MKRKPLSICMEFTKRPSEQMKKESQDGINRIKNEKIDPFWEYFKKYSPEQLLLQFKNSKTEFKQWEVIPFEQYYNLLKRFTDSPIGSRIPDNVVTNWINLICKNLAQVISIEILFGRTADFPYDIVEKYYNVGTYANERFHLIKNMNALSYSGFYKWAVSPQGNPAWNDWGFMKVYDILRTYREDMQPEYKLILIDRCLNVVHGRGPMAEYFIEGGKESLDKIAGKVL